MQKKLDTIPGWIILLTGYLLVVVLGYIDYLTGDYSILIFYLIPVSFVAWFMGRWAAFFISLAAGVARFVSDYFTYSSFSVFKYWNCFQDLIFLFMMGFLVALVKKLLREE